MSARRNTDELKSYDVKRSLEQLSSLFEQANEDFLINERELILSGVNERTLCGALALHLHDLIKDDPVYAGYYTDLEYNRNKGNIKTAIKTINGPELKVIRINCDLILHSRGNNPGQDNLIAIEMKKSTRPAKAKQDDRERLEALTADSFDDIWSFDGHTLPEHVCRYVLGVYYELDLRQSVVSIEYYHKRRLIKQYTRRIK